LGGDEFVGHGGKLTRREEIGKRAGELENPRSRSPPRVAVVSEELVGWGRVVFFQALGLWVIGVLLGGAAFWGASVASPVPLRMPPGVLALLLACQTVATVAAGFWVLRKLRRIDPAAVFQS